MYRFEAEGEYLESQYIYVTDGSGTELYDKIIEDGFTLESWLKGNEELDTEFCENQQLSGGALI